MAWRVKDLGETVAFANAQPGPDFSALTPAVVRCAESGDAIATEILERAGAELARQVAIVWAKMQKHGETAATVAFTGSVVEKIAAARESMRHTLAERCPALAVVTGAINSMDGAMWRARQLH